MQHDFSNAAREWRGCGSMKDQQSILLIASGGLLGLTVLCCGCPLLVMDREGLEQARARSADRSVGNEEVSIQTTQASGEVRDQNDPPKEQQQSINATPLASDDTDETAVKDVEAVETAPFDTVPFEGFAIAGETQLRSFSSADGQFSTMAKLKALKQGFVLLEKTDSKRVSVELKKLSRQDYDYVCSVLSVQPSGTVRVGKVKPEGISPKTVVFTDVFGTDVTVNLVSIRFASLSRREAVPLYQAFVDMVYDKHGWIEVLGEDSEGHKLAVLYVGGKNINLATVAQGTAWYEPSEGENLRFANAQFVAESEKRGLWATELASEMVE